jgi:tetratricopeptide (TPR) repeat protein
VLGIGVTVLASGLGWQHYSTGLPARLREQSRTASERGRWEEAAAISARLIELNPGEADAWLARARALHELGDLAGSARALEDMPGQGAQKMTALLALAELQLGPQNAPQAAERTLLRLLEMDPSSAYAHQRLLSFYALTVQRQPLVRTAHLAMQQGCEPVETYLYLFLADELEFTNGVEVNRRWLAGDPSSELFRVAEAYHLARSLAGGAPSEDLALVRRIRELADNLDRNMQLLLDRYPANLELLAWHIERAIERGDIDRTVDLLARLPGDADDDNRFWRFSGWAKVRLGRVSEADADYARALQLNPLDWSTRNLLAGLRREQQRFADVDKLQQLVARARDLGREVKAQPDVRSVPVELLARMADYAAECGDDFFAQSLRRHLSRRNDHRGREG